MSRNYTEIWPELEATLLKDADNVLTELGLWDWLKTTSWDEVVKSESLHTIMHKLKNSDSIMFVLKNLQHIATEGWDVHYNLLVENKKRKALVEKFRLMYLEGKMSHETYVHIRDTA
jgi:hypothetical protein